MPGFVDTLPDAVYFSAWLCQAEHPVFPRGVVGSASVQTMLKAIEHIDTAIKNMVLHEADDDARTRSASHLVV